MCAGCVEIKSKYKICQTICIFNLFFVKPALALGEIFDKFIRIINWAKL